jgi:hypothetical protein
MHSNYVINIAYYIAPEPPVRDFLIYPGALKQVDIIQILSYVFIYLLISLIFI